MSDPLEVLLVDSKDIKPQKNYVNRRFNANRSTIRPYHSPDCRLVELPASPWVMGEFQWLPAYKNLNGFYVFICNDNLCPAKLYIPAGLVDDFVGSKQ